MAKCPELDLVTEMDTPAEALQAMVEMIREYAEDYRAREELFAASPNRAHHKPYVRRSRSLVPRRVGAVGAA